MQQAFNLPQQQVVLLSQIQYKTYYYWVRFNKNKYIIKLIISFSNQTPTNKSQRSHSPNQRIVQNCKESSYDQRSQISNTQLGEIEMLKQKVKQLQNENESLRNQLDKANQKIKQVKNTENGQINQSVFKTTTFELVVLQKAIEQLQQLKLALANQQNRQSMQSEKALEKQNQEETLIVNSELRSKVSVERLDPEKESSKSQEKIQQFEQQGGRTKEEGQKTQTSDPSEIRQVNSSISFIQSKGCGSNAYRSGK